METVCRLCVSKPESYVHVFDNEGKSLNLEKKISQCLQIWLYPEDPLPKTLCLQCVQKLNDTFLFFETCSRAQTTLQVLYGVSSEKERTTYVRANPGDILNEDKALIKMEPGTDSRTNAPESGNGNRPKVDQLPSDLTIDLELKSSSVSEHPEDILECLLENPENTAALTQLQDLHENVESGPEISTKRRGRPLSKQGASKQTKKEGSNRTRGKPSNEQASPSKKQASEPWPETDDVVADGAENGDIVSADEEQSEDRVASPGDCLQEESGSETESLPRKCKKTNSETSKKSSGTKGQALEDYPWQCVVCDRILETLQDLKNHHESVHGQAPVFKCMQCSKVYNRYRSFSRHVKLHHNPKKFSCDICGKSFAQKTVLQSHSAVHSEERPFSCDQCGKRFKQFSSLYLHNKNHLPNSEREKFRCEQCDKEFASKHTLETHRKVHTGERNFICDICGKSFIAKGSLDYHILSHTGDKPHDCSVCGKCFKTPRLLAKHVTLHSGIKPHQCDVCGKQFREKGALREHSRIHTGAMPYACDYCGKRFRFKGILTVHTRQHTGERPYACLDCPRQFTNWANYNKHMKRRHRNVEGTEQTCPNTGRRTFQSHASAAAAAAGLALDTPTYASNGMAAPTNMNLLDTAGSSLLMPASHQLQENKIVLHGSLPHLAQSDLLPPQNVVPSLSIASLASSLATSLATGLPGNLRHAKDEEEDEDAEETSEEEDDERQRMETLGEVPESANNQLPRQMYIQDNSNSSNSMTVPSAFSTNYSNNSHTKMAAMFQSHHNNKMSSMFYQEAVADNTSQTNTSMGMSTYHMNPYMSPGLPASMPPSLPPGLTSMGNMGYYLQPIHHGDHTINTHQSHNMHISHNRISNNQ